MVQYENARDFWRQCLQLVMSGKADQYVENVAVLFTEDMRAGIYDRTFGVEFLYKLHEVDKLSKLWNNEPRKTAGELLLSALEKVEVSPDQLMAISMVLARDTAAPDINIPVGADEDDPMLTDETDPVVLTSVCDPCPPKKIRDDIAKRVIGQEDAVGTAAMITYSHLNGRRTHAVFCGPEGCGKSEIWRTLSKEYPDRIRMIDFSRFSADGGKWSVHLRDIFEGIDPEDIRRRGLIVVLDEADKIVCEHTISAGGTDYNALAQNSLLKMLDGDTIEFGAENGKKAFSVDCSKVSVILLGVFENLLTNKTDGSKHIGFSATPKAEAGRHKDISYDKLISAGMRRWIAGRINRIVALDPLTVQDYKSILLGPVKSDIEYAIAWLTYIDDAAATVLAEKAAATGLGVRWMRSTVQNAIEDVMSDQPVAMIYGVVLQDGEVCCQAWMPREVPERVVRELHIEKDIEMVADDYDYLRSHLSEAK